MDDKNLQSTPQPQGNESSYGDKYAFSNEAISQTPGTGEQQTMTEQYSETQYANAQYQGDTGLGNTAGYQGETPYQADYDAQALGYSVAGNQVSVQERQVRPVRQRTDTPAPVSQQGSVPRTAFIDQASIIGKQVLADFGELFGKIFSGHPMNAFAAKISHITLICLIILEILIGGLMWGRLMSAIVNSGASLAGLLGMSSGGVKIFGVALGFGLLQQFCSMVLVLLLVFLMSIALRSRAASFIEYVRTIAIASIPKMVGSLLAIITSLFLPAGMVFAFMLAILMLHYIFLYAGVQKCHPSRTFSPFWLFLIIILLNNFLLFKSVSWILMSVLTSFSL